jgi:hypothetical protein
MCGYFLNYVGVLQKFDKKEVADINQTCMHMANHVIFGLNFNAMMFESRYNMIFTLSTSCISIILWIKTSSNTD